VCPVEGGSHAARLCTVYSWNDGRGYGFTIKAEKGHAEHLINCVDAMSPAAAAGLREQDRIIEVNCVNVEELSHDELATHIRADANRVCLLVVDPDSDNFFRQKRVTPTSDMQDCLERISSPETKPQGLPMPHVHS